MEKCEGCDKELSGSPDTYACIDGLRMCKTCEQYDKEESETED